MDGPFFVIDTRARNETLGHTDATEDGPYNRRFPNSRCIGCGEQSAVAEWLPPYIVQLETWSNRYGDISSVRPGYLIVSDRFRSAFLSTQLGGIASFSPVAVSKVTRHVPVNEPAPAYFKADISPSRTALDLDASGFVWQRPSQVCLQCLGGGHLLRWKRLAVRSATWDGADIFQPIGCSRVMVSRAFATMMATSDLCGVLLRPAEETWWDGAPWKNDEKAKELAERPLGDDLYEKRGMDGTIFRLEPSTRYMLALNSDRSIRRLDILVDLDFWMRLGESC